MTERENEMTAMNTSGKRQIKASEVKPGMTIRAEYLGVTHECTVDSAGSVSSTGGMEVRTGLGGSVYLAGRKPVTVLSEPAPAQPEEPRWIAARAKVGDRRFFRVDESDRPWRKADCMGRVFLYRYSWSDICALGPVTVIPDQGWTVPTEPTPEVPEKLYIWPICDEHLRGHKWRDGDGDVVQYIDGAWRYLWSFGPGNAHTAPLECAPWTRIDVVPEEVKAGDWPEDDEHLRAYSWVDHNGNGWAWNEAEDEWDCKDSYGRLLTCLGIPSSGPWTRRDD